MEKGSIPLFNSLTYMARTKKTEETPVSASPQEAVGTEPLSGDKQSTTASPTEEGKKEEELEDQTSQEQGGEGQGTEEPPAKQEPMEKIIPRHVGDVLKVYPQYQSLYVDDKGGAYTEDTIEAIRGEAELYKNPYYIAKP